MIEIAGSEKPDLSDLKIPRHTREDFLNNTLPMWKYIHFVPFSSGQVI